MQLLHHVRHLRTRLRLERRTLRFRLTVLYGSLFLLAGAALLAITNVLVGQSTGDFLFYRSMKGEVFITQKTSMPVKVPSVFVPVPGKGLQVPSAATIVQAEAQVDQLIALANQQHANEQHQLLVGSGIALAIMAVVSIGLGWFVAGRALRPLRTIKTTTRKISASSLHERLALEGPQDEIKELGDTFDGLLGRLETSFEAQRRFVANASHELRTPLTRQRTLVEVALGDREATVASLRASYARVLAAVEQQEGLIEALLTLARSERGLERCEPFDLATIAAEVLRIRRPEIERRGLHLRATLATAGASGDPRLVERLVANLVDNAIRHNVAEGQIQVAAETRQGRAIVVVANSGPIIPPAEVDRLFQPFQRLGADRTGNRDGLGLGLSIVQAIATAHAAELTAYPCPEGGLAIEVRFPDVVSGANGHSLVASAD